MEGKRDREERERVGVGDREGEREAERQRKGQGERERENMREHYPLCVFHGVLFPNSVLQLPNPSKR